MIQPHIQRAQLLMEQSRFEMAERELRGALAQDPDDPFAHALLAICLAQTNKAAEAIAACRRAISLAPDMPFAHYALAAVLHDEERFDESFVAANEAIRLDPFEPRHFSLLASIHVARKRWKDALMAAEQGLAIDAEDTRCANMRAIALTQLGRRAEAGQTIDAALARDPEDATSHANMGWTLLHQRQPRKAMEHFAEALRLEPHNEWARAGIVEAMKARNPIYRVMLAYFLWMGRLSAGAQWALIIGAFVLIRILRVTAEQNPDVQPFVLPVIITYAVFVWMSWVADPLFNLMLRLDRFGRHALSPDQVTGSTLFGLCILGAVASLGIALAASQPLFFPIAIGCALLTLPIAGLFAIRPERRQVMTLLVAALALVGIAAIAVSFYDEDIAAGLSLIFIIGVTLSMWTSNAIRTSG